MLTCIFILFLFIPLLAQAEDFIAGKDYESLKSTIQSEEGNNKIPVIEFFSFGCPWCYHIEPALAQWTKEQIKSIQFSQVPVVFNKNWAYYAKAYYPANALHME